MNAKNRIYSFHSTFAKRWTWSHAWWTLSARNLLTHLTKVCGFMKRDSIHFVVVIHINKSRYRAIATSSLVCMIVVVVVFLFTNKTTTICNSSLHKFKLCVYPLTFEHYVYNISVHLYNAPDMCEPCEPYKK